MALRLFLHGLKAVCNITEGRIAASFSHLGVRNYSASQQDSKIPEPKNVADSKMNGKDSEHPVLVASHTNKCIVGCCCGPDSPTMNWFFIEEGPAQTCDCGFYFKLDKVAQDQWIPEYSRVMQVNENIPDPRYARRRMPFDYTPEVPVQDKTGSS
uniref:Uncharacterized protein LOC104266137 n=1 Tax=Phallusia mammillata TaxID=59560 RepID=A0A6F9DJ20_9ASCI|nr:uncharacterized protein LOC104266137 [Phallusia mammillata]